jgi:hypothetical protein
LRGLEIAAQLLTRRKLPVAEMAARMQPTHKRFGQINRHRPRPAPAARLFRGCSAAPARRDDPFCRNFAIFQQAPHSFSPYCSATIARQHARSKLV